MNEQSKYFQMKLFVFPRLNIVEEIIDFLRVIS